MRKVTEKENGGHSMGRTVIIKPKLRERYDKFMARGRVLFFSAPCGAYLLLSYNFASRSSKDAYP